MGTGEGQGSESLELSSRRLHARGSESQRRMRFWATQAAGRETCRHCRQSTWDATHGCVGHNPREVSCIQALCYSGGRGRNGVSRTVPSRASCLGKYRRGSSSDHGSGPSQELVVCVWWGVGGGDVCQRAPRWAWMRSCLTRLAAPPAAASSPPSIPASTESFLLHNTFFSALASPSPGPQMLFPVSAWQTPTYPQPLCEVPPPPAPLARWQGVALL